MDNTKQEYWFCIIGSTTRDKLPDGADFPLRQRIKDAYEKLTGQDDYTCSSGWGMTREMVDTISALQNIKFLFPEKFKKMREKIMSVEIK